MIHTKKIEYPEYTVMIDYYDDTEQLVVIVKDKLGMIIEGITINDGDEHTINEQLN